MKNLITLFLVFAWGAAAAVPVQWTLNDVTLEETNVFTGDVNYRAVTGSFIYDAATNEYSEISILTEAGYYIWVGHFYSENAYTWESDPVESPSNNGVILNASAPCGADACETALILEYASALTDAGGIVGLQTLVSYEQHQSFGCGCIGDVRFLTSGSLTGTVVPIPSAVWLFGSALAGLGWLRRKQAA